MFGIGWLGSLLTLMVIAVYWLYRWERSLPGILLISILMFVILVGLPGLAFMLSNRFPYSAVGFFAILLLIPYYFALYLWSKGVTPRRACQLYELRKLHKKWYLVQGDAEEAARTLCPSDVELQGIIADLTAGSPSNAHSEYVQSEAVQIWRLKMRDRVMVRLGVPAADVERLNYLEHELKDLSSFW